MVSKKSIWIYHSDETFIAEVAFWATSAGYELIKVADRSDLMRDELPMVSATIVELSGRNDQDVDVVEALSKRSRGKVIAVSELDAKTNASLRHLFHAKQVRAILLSRSDFTTRQLEELFKSREGQPTFDPDILARAISNGLLIVHYQPKVPFCAAEAGFGVEALCRIQDPELGIIYPDSFVPLAEAYGLIQELTDAVTVQAFRDLSVWDREGRALRLAINISPRLLSSKRWFELFEQRCQEYNIDPKRITLEVTESSSQIANVLALEILSRLRLKGFLLSIDDFGTGFSSLETLYKLPFGELKIDKGFVFDLLKNSEARALVELTVGLARKLGLKICAEGVETQELFDELRNLQCDDAQGYFISRPLAANAVLPFFSQWEKRDAVRERDASNKFSAIHGLLADLLAVPDDEEDPTIVLSMADCEASLETARDIAARLPPLVMTGDLIGSLNVAHRAIGAAPDPDFRRKLVCIQQELEQSLLNSMLVMRNDQECIQVLGGDSFTIGRELPSTAVDAAVPCRWLSRGNKNLRLSHEGGVWLLCDLGSTNGHFLDGIRLQPQQSVPLRDETVLEVGKAPGAPARAWLRFRLSEGNAVELSFGTHGEEQTGAKLKWLFFHDEANASQEPSTSRVLNSGANSSAMLSFRNQGLWITPRHGGSVEIGGHEFLQATPVAVGYDLSFGGQAWRIEKLEPNTAAPQFISTTAVA